MSDFDFSEWLENWRHQAVPQLSRHELLTLRRLLDQGRLPTAVALRGGRGKIVWLQTENCPAYEKMRLLMSSEVDQALAGMEGAHE
jgi:hypothetical protein